MKTLEEEAKEYAEIGIPIDIAYSNGLFYGFTAGATSKWAEAEKIKAQIDLCQRALDWSNEVDPTADYIEKEFVSLKQKLKELEDESNLKKP